MDEQFPQIAVAALTDAAQLVDAACGVLPWHKTQSGGEMRAGFEVGGISHRGDQRGRCDPPTPGIAIISGATKIGNTRHFVALELSLRYWTSFLSAA